MFKNIFKREQQMPDQPKCTKQFDPMKPCRTQDGKVVRVICTDRKSHRGNSIVVLCEDGNIEIPLIYQRCGHFCEDHSNKEYDLINIPEAESELERVKEELKKLIDDSRSLRAILIKQVPYEFKYITALQEIELRIITIWKSLDK